MKLKYNVWITNVKYGATVENYRYNIETSGLDMRAEGWVLAYVNETPEFELPDRQTLRMEAVKSLKVEQDEIRKAAMERMQRIDEQIKQLLAIENNA